MAAAECSKIDIRKSCSKRDHKGHRQVAERQPGRLRDGNKALDGLQVPLVGHLFDAQA